MFVLTRGLWTVQYFRGFALLTPQCLHACVWCVCVFVFALATKGKCYDNKKREEQKKRSLVRALTVDFKVFFGGMALQSQCQTNQL